MGQMYTVVVIKNKINKTVQTYAESLNEAIEKVRRADFRVNEVKTRDENKCQLV